MIICRVRLPLLEGRLDNLRGGVFLLGRVDFFPLLTLTFVLRSEVLLLSNFFADACALDAMTLELS
jgi:hypothetical protein